MPLFSINIVLLSLIHNGHVSEQIHNAHRQALLSQKLREMGDRQKKMTDQSLEMHEQYKQSLKKLIANADREVAKLRSLPASLEVEGKIASFTKFRDGMAARLRQFERYHEWFADKHGRSPRP